ncbi:MAG: RNase adapter RapZ [Pseudomonadota bacterium]|nr:RNase adapter RapZ [Pseudomonadota bacterium]
MNTIESAPPIRKVVLITGMSGAGLSTALKALEDIGYESVDNLPLFLLDPLLVREDLRHRPLAVVIDSRTRDFSVDGLLSWIEARDKDPSIDRQLLFLDCIDSRLLHRFTETRRRHPLALDRPVADGIARERTLLAPVMAVADSILDTTDWNVHDLKRNVAGRFGTGKRPPLTIQVMSFSYRKGVPRESDLVFDVRFLANPHYNKRLRIRTGMDDSVAAFVEKDPDFAAFFARLEDFILSLLPRFSKEGKSYLTVAVGCTGGQHRSVFVAEKLAAVLVKAGHAVQIRHREIGNYKERNFPLRSQKS